ncbi:GNAT family N-acetyltransferase [Pseudanabaena sp. FACHB-1998]|uniref:GNAT family N-acetyltransferase n=1 Tax=Pseudanabaena sp. FACHB-1998 TaxID=2692858 RepID=UPI0016812001|nr:GNAT family N-acetyltransferase [Pseudanabaena sp. FACHB-1998]MBD2177252.1 GNAT family N-acetyltransferase [Pseudanabaena sp. FACHB-1998]
MDIQKYDFEQKKTWDKFILNSKNGTFLFFRDYMEYHADKFSDFSLMFFDDNHLIAVMPANLDSQTLISHGGLTFGGVISSNHMKANKMLEIFASLKIYLIQQKIDKLVYKAIPHIYHRIPSEEDLYALFVNKATLFRRDIASTILLRNRPSYSKGRKHIINKSRKFLINVEQSFDFLGFMSIEIEHLGNKYGKKPVHTPQEIEYLASIFPNNIKLFAAFKDKIMLAGVLIYENSEVAHAQYIAANELGKQIGALDAILDFLINSYYINKKYFDFGISTEDQGKYLNTNLISNKESFGARAVTYDFYEMSVNQI